MAERRQAHRREPIEVEVRGEVIEAHPLPWLRRNDFGNEVMRQYSELLNSTLRAIQDEQSDTPQLEMYLNDRLSDPMKLLQLAYPHGDTDFFEVLEIDEVMELLYAALEINQLENLRNLIDPNWITPTQSGGNDSSGMEVEQNGTPNQQSSPDSESSDSAEATSST